MATRASSRAKTAPTVAPPTTRTTRARSTTAKHTAATHPESAPAARKPATRKPLGNRENAVEPPVSKLASKTTTTRKTAKAANTAVSDTDREPIMAYLRIRPHLGEDDAAVQPYLMPLSDTAVCMSDPQDQQGKFSHFRTSTALPSSTYTFSHVFPPDTPQSDFFIKTTLPLVQDLLQGQNGLLFTYGVTNSGKTYTVQGGNKEGSAGILPRTLDVIFNSIDGLHGDGRFRPVRLHGVEPADLQDESPPQMTPEPALAQVFGPQMDVIASDSDVDSTLLKVDRNYEYTVWISYAEVYNEKVFDLLASVKDDSNLDGNLPRTTAAKPLVLTRAALPLRPSPASDNPESASQGKYISGLRQFRVHSAMQAKALVKLGQLHRRVFGTLANRESSRSHGMVIIKLVKGHRGERDDPTALQISRLTLVDLAGSERTKHTHTTGDRLKEAGSINKSLMVLGQCMEVMRSNQRKLAMSLSQGVGHDDQLDTREVKKALAVVPFRHSKLTEALMDYFVGDGRVVMIVNVNPYDTGYDENSHVMRFAALAREVYVTPAPAPVHRLPNGLKAPGKVAGNTIKELGPLTLKGPEIAPKPHRRKVTISIGGPGSGKKATEAVLEVLEEDESNDGQNGDDENDGPINPLVDALFDEVELLRMQLFESEMRCAMIEAETREEVMREMEARMKKMEEMYTRRMMKELEHNELKTDAKIDMLHQSGLFGSPIKKAQLKRPPSDLSEEEKVDVEMSLIVDDEAEGGSALESDGHHEESPSNRVMSLSPLSKKSKAESKGGVDTLTNAQTSRNVAKALFADPEPGSENDYPTGSGSEDDEDAWIPPKASSTKSKATRQGKGRQVRLSHLENEMYGLFIRGDPDDSAVILPVTKSKARKLSQDVQGDNEDYEDEDEFVPLPKRKRQLGKQKIMTEELIEKATYAMERKAQKAEGTKNIRRLTGT